MKRTFRIYSFSSFQIYSSVSCSHPVVHALIPIQLLLPVLINMKLETQSRFGLEDLWINPKTRIQRAEYPPRRDFTRWSHSSKTLEAQHILSSWKTRARREQGFGECGMCETNFNDLTVLSKTSSAYLLLSIRFVLCLKNPTFS